MAIKTRSEWKTAKNAVIIANGTGAITGPVLNTLLEDFADSVLFRGDVSIENFTVVTTGGTITLDFQLFREALFTGSAAIGADKTWVFANQLNARRLFFRFNLSGLHVQTLPATVKMPDWTGGWDDTAKTWTPSQIGDYEAEATYNGTQWNMKINGVF